MTYPVYKIPTGCTVLNVGKNRTSNQYVLLVKKTEDEEKDTTSTKFAIEFETSRQVEAYINALNILLKRMKKEGK